jgi:hypothetical protein
MWAQAYEQQAQADTNKPPFTKEAQAEISALATEVEKLQIELLKDKVEDAKVERKGGGKAAERAAKQFETLKKLARIQELLPKDKNGGGGQNQQNQQNQNQEQNKDKNKDENKDQNQKQNQDQQQDQQENKDDRKEQEEKQSAAEEQEKKNDEQVEDVLRRAQERSDQHEADKKARMKKAPLPANERDW